MDNRILALVGVGLLIVGVFLPIVNVPILGTMNMLLPQGSIGDGIFILVLALIGGGLALAGKVRHVVWPALLSLAFTAWKYVSLQGTLNEAQARLSDQMGVDSGMSGSLPDAFQMNLLGWAVLGIGGIVLLVAGILAWKGKSGPTASV
jgi:hypothetical protein